MPEVIIVNIKNGKYSLYFIIISALYVNLLKKRENSKPLAANKNSV